MRANRYLHIAVIGATLLFLVLWQKAAAGRAASPLSGVYEAGNDAW